MGIPGILAVIGLVASIITISDHLNKKPCPVCGNKVIIKNRKGTCSCGHVFYID